MGNTTVNAQLALMKIEENRISKHPVELSGPSTKPHLQFMGLPLEVRREIYRSLLVKKQSVRLQSNWRPNDILWTKSLSVGKGITTILSACKQTATEGTSILYGENTFECSHVRVFKNLFIHGQGNGFGGIGKHNAAKIKKAIFGLPLIIIRHNQDSPACAPFLDFLCTDLTGLQRLTLKTETFTNVGAQANRKQTARIRPLITTAARVAKYHPTLRKAIWRRWSGNVFQNNYLAGNFYIDLLAEGFETSLEGSITKKDAFGHDFESVDVLLNILLIQQTSWLENTVWEDITNFRLENSKLTSRVDDAEIATWPGEVEYEPLLELGPEDRAAMVDQNKGRHIRGQFVGGRFVDGQFIRGQWFGSDFLQGKWIDLRLVDGELVEFQFAEGQWVGEDFVEGKWVDGQLVKGMWVKKSFVEGKWSDGLFIKGKWTGEHFIEGTWIGEQFYEGKWKNGVCLRGSWVQKPKITGLS